MRVRIPRTRAVDAARISPRRPHIQLGGLIEFATSTSR